jgi:hypothetical protein
MRRAAKSDKNQPGIVKTLRQIPGLSVLDIHQLKNCCDILVGFQGRNYLFEIKSDKKKKLTVGEKNFQDRWAGQIHTICSAKDILNILGIHIEKSRII